MAIARRTVGAAKPASAAATVNFGDDSFYSAGGGLPEGNYLWASVVWMMHSGFSEKAKSDPERLTCMVTLKDLADLEAPERQQAYSAGPKAHESFLPNTEDGGHSLIAVPGGKATTLNNSTNWAVLRQSLKDAGLPDGILSNDLSVLEGMWAHMQMTDPPAERASFQSSTGDVQQERRNNKIATVSEILEDGKPWEGTGGMPEASAAPKKAVAGKPSLVKPLAAKPVTKAAPATEPEASGDETEIHELAVAGLSSFLESKPGGGPKIAVRMAAGKYLKEQVDAETAQTIIDAMYMDDDALGALLGECGFVLAGTQVKPAA